MIFCSMKEYFKGGLQKNISKVPGGYSGRRRGCRRRCCRSETCTGICSAAVGWTPPGEMIDSDDDHDAAEDDGVDDWLWCWCWLLLKMIPMVVLNDDDYDDDNDVDKEEDPISSKIRLFSATNTFSMEKVTFWKVWLFCPLIFLEFLFGFGFCDWGLETEDYLWKMDFAKQGKPPLKPRLLRPPGRQPPLCRRSPGRSRLAWTTQIMLRQQQRWQQQE